MLIIQHSVTCRFNKSGASLCGMTGTQNQSCHTGKKQGDCSCLTHRVTLNHKQNEMKAMLMVPQGHFTLLCCSGIHVEWHLTQ